MSEINSNPSFLDTPSNPTNACQKENNYNHRFTPNPDQHVLNDIDPFLAKSFSCMTAPKSFEPASPPKEVCSDHFTSTSVYSASNQGYNNHLTTASSTHANIHHPVSPWTTPLPVQEKVPGFDEDRSKHVLETPKEIIVSLRGFPLFKSAPEAFLQAIARKLVLQAYPAHSFIITEGEEARSMYWIIRGSVGIVSRDGESIHAELGPGTFFGEIGILFDCPRTASVQAREKCILAFLTFSALNEVSPAYPVMEQAIREEAQERLAILKKNHLLKNNTQRQKSRHNLIKVPFQKSPLQHEQVGDNRNLWLRKQSIGDLGKYLEHTGVREILEEMSLFDKLPAEILHKLALSIEPKAYGPFEMIFQQNSPGRDIYFIIEGQVEVLDEESNTRIARLSCGSYFGEMAFLSWAESRTASVRTITEVDCLVITEETLITLCKDYPEFQNHIEETANSRIGSNQSHDIWQTDSNTGSSRYLSYWRTTMTKSSSEDASVSEEVDIPQGKQFDLDPFHVKKTDSASKYEPTNKPEEHKGVGLFSKSWNTLGCFGSSSHRALIIPPHRDTEFHETDPHDQLTSSLSPELSQSIKTTTINQSPATISTLPLFSSISQSPINFSPTHAGQGSNYNDHFNTNNNASTNNRTMGNNNSATTPHHSSKPFLFSGFPESIPEESQAEIGSGSILANDPPTSDGLQYETLPSVLGVRRHMNQGLLLHPRSKRTKLMSRRRSSIFNKGPLPDFVQLKVFQHLDLKSLMVMQRVCQHWKQILQTSQQLITELDLRPYNTTINDKTIISITNFAGMRPKKVDISNCFHLTDEGFSYLVNGIGLSKINVFKMKSVWEVSTMAIMDLTVPSIGSELEEIDLSNCRKVSDSTLTRLIGWVISSCGPDGQASVANGTVVGCSKLRRLSLSYCKQITDRSMYHMAMFASDRIEFLDLTRCTTITDHGFSFWNFRSFHNLRHLCLADCTFLTDKSIISIASAANNLHSLVLSFCCALTDVSVEVLAVGCPRLQKLDLAYCGSAVSDASLSTAALHLTELETLSVRGCVRVTNMGIDNILRMAGQRKLRFLDITQCRNISDQIEVRDKLHVTIKQF